MSVNRGTPIADLKLPNARHRNIRRMSQGTITQKTSATIAYRANRIPVFINRSVSELRQVKAAFLASQYLDANATVAHESRSKATYSGRYINMQHIMPVASDTLTQPTASMPNLYPQNPSQSALKTAKPRLNTDKYAIAAPIRPRKTWLKKVLAEEYSPSLSSSITFCLTNSSSLTATAMPIARPMTKHTAKPNISREYCLKKEDICLPAHLVSSFSFIRHFMAIYGAI